MNEFNEYLDHYLQTQDALTFLLAAILSLLVVFGIIYIFSRIKYASQSRSSFADKQQPDDPNPLRTIFCKSLERFYEIIFSGTSILFFMASYYLIERFLTEEPLVSLWDKYSDFLLLFLIILSCIINSILDAILVRLKHLDKDEKASVRLTGMLYMILIFCYIKFIYENDNYDFFISYFLGLMIGRFVYFDASFRDFINSLAAAFKNIPIMLLALACTGFMSFYGFGSKYLIKHIGVITNVFFIHLFLCVGIFIIFHLHFADLVTFKSRRK